MIYTERAPGSIHNALHPGTLLNRIEINRVAPSPDPSLRAISIWWQHIVGEILNPLRSSQFFEDPPDHTLESANAVYSEFDFLFLHFISNVVSSQTMTAPVSTNMAGSRIPW